uniref:Uncharacterized protein n=1 Tax=Glossina palpalis gambiensis TaxID=67801 RepID=A0A1B0C5F1_9MUSC
MPILKTKSKNVIALNGCSNANTEAFNLQNQRKKERMSYTVLEQMSSPKIDRIYLHEREMSSWSLISIYSGHTPYHEWDSKDSLNGSGTLFPGEQMLLTGLVCMLSRSFVQYQDFRNMFNQTSPQLGNDDE